MKRLFDILFSLFLLILLSPFFLIISLLIIIDNYGKVFFLQKRVGKNNIDFNLYKFRTMYTDSEKKGLLTVGEDDLRITKAGKFLRKYKLDELPQLLNVLRGSMSIVGPRPEVRKYVDLYNQQQMKVLNIKPGITDYASIEYSNENEILAMSTDPEKTYIEEIMPRKLEINIEYVKNHSLINDLKIILKTIGKIISS